MATPTFNQIDQGGARPKKRRARRSPTEIGQSVPSTKKGQSRKAKALRETEIRKAKTRYRRRTGEGITRSEVIRGMRELERITRRHDRQGYDPDRASGITPEQARTYEWQRASGRTYAPPDDPVGARLEQYAPTGVRIARAILGDKPGATGPTLEEFGNIAATIAGSGATSAIRGTLRAATAARTAKATKAATSARAARATPKPPKSAPKKTRAKAAAKRPAQKAKARYSKPERKMRKARRVQRYANLATNPVAVPVATSDPGRAFVEGNIRANPAKAAATTLEAVPATFAFLGSAAASAYRAARTGDTGPLKGTARAGKEAFKALEPLVSGDPEKVEQAVEDDVGYVFAPLLPRGAVSAPARAVGRAAKATGKGAARTARGIAPQGPPPSGGPGPLRHAAQVVGGRKTRKRVAQLRARTVEPERRAGVRVAHEIERKARRSKGARSLHNLHGPEAGAAAVVIARYGVTRKNPLDRLEDVRRSLDESDVNYVNTAKTIEWVKQHPKVLEDKNLWRTVAELKKGTDAVATSPRATHLAQGRVAGVLPPEKRVPTKARPYTRATTREDAHQDVKETQAKVKRLRQEAARDTHKAELLRAKVRERAARLGGNVHRIDTTKETPLNRKLQEILELEAGARGKIAEAKAESRRAKALSRELRPFTTGDTPPSRRQRRPKWEAELVREYVDDVRANRHPDLDDPAWLAERDPAFQPIGGLGGPDIPSIGARAAHIKTGRAERTDVAERSLTAALKDSIIAPRTQRGIHRFIRRFEDEFSEARKIDGHDRRVVTAAQWNRLVDRGEVDPRTHAPLPVRHFKQAVESEGFDLAEFHGELTNWMATDMRRLDKTPGTKYAIYPREALREFADQLNPNRGAFEAATSTLGSAATRIVLFSPAWLAAQVVNEGTQALSAVGAHGMGGAAADLIRLRRSDPDGYQSLLHLSGDSAPAAQPVPPRISMSASDYASYGDAVRAARKTPVGRFLHDAVRLRTFANLDRWKSTRIRAMVALAHSNKELGTFTRGLSGMLRSQAHISAQLKGMTRRERNAWLAKNPKAVQRHLDYADDVMGNWDSFTRFERQFGPLAAFYPYLRMSFRWTFMTYPKRHPVKAQILYLLAQQNRDELEKVLGTEPTFLEGAMPVVYGKDGEPDAVLPAGQRFGAPGSNAILEAVGRENVTGILRALNPAIGAGVHGVTGLDPFSGDKVAQKPGEIGLHALNQLLSLSPAVRVAGANKVGEGEESEVAKVFKEIDPNRAVRSALNPFIPLSAERARMQTTLSRALDAVKDDPEYGDLVEAILEGDEAKLDDLYQRVDLADDARDVLDRLLPSSRAEERALDQAGTILREGSPERQRSKPSGYGSTSSSYGSVFGSGYGLPNSGLGSSSYQKVFGR